MVILDTFPDTDSNNVFTGFSKDVTCASSGNIELRRKRLRATLLS